MNRAMSLRARGLVAVCGLCVALSSAVATPPVLDRVPDDAMLTIVIPSPQSLQKSVSALATAAESPLPIPAIEDLLAMAGIVGGVDLTKSIAIVALGPKDKPNGAKDAKAGEKGEDGKPIEIDEDAIDLAENAERTLMLVPVTTYAAFLENFGVKPAGEGKIDSFVSNDGTDMHAKDLGGGYAVMGEQKELVQAFTGKTGDKSVKSRMSKAGEALSDASDIVAIVNMDRLRPMAEKGLKEMEREAKERAANLGADAQDQNLAAFKWIGESFVRDTQMLVGGLKFGSMGVSMDMVGAFKPDSYMAKVFAAKGNATALMGKLPGGAYLWAGAIDTSSPGVKAMMKDLIGKIELPGGPEARKATLATMDNAEGQAAIVGFPVGGAFAGIFTSTVQYTAAKDPAAMLKAVKDNMAAMNGQKVENMVYSAKFTENASKAGDTPIHAWETKLAAAEGEEMNSQVSQAMPFLFGPQGMPVGYVAQAPGGLYTTYAKNTELMGKALGAAKGDNLGADSSVKQSQELLPKDRVAEMYIGTRGILDLALPFAAMGGMAVSADKIPEKLPPIAASISAVDGAMRFSMVVPTPVIKTGVSLGTEINNAMEEGGGGGGAKPEKGAGQPRF